MSKCRNLIELRAEGSGATGVIFANGGKLQRAYIPEVTTLTMKNLNNLETLDVAGYAKLNKLIAENIHSVDTHAIVDASTALNTVRLTSINWGKELNIQNTSILDRMYDMRGVDNNGYETSKSVVTGYIWSASGKDRDIERFNELWPHLTIEADAVTEQFMVTFINDDGTVLDIQYVDAGTKPVDPITREENPIDIPTKSSTVSTDYEYDAWDTPFNFVWSDQTIKATYKEITREYTVRYISNSTVLQTSKAKYGSVVEYRGEIPTYTAGEVSNKYFLFDHWDKSGYVNGDKEINAVYDNCSYEDGYFDFLNDENDPRELSDLRPVELYMLTSIVKSGSVNFALKDYVQAKDSIIIPLGNDFSYDDVEEVVLIDEETVFDGSNKIDTGIDLMSEDRDFVVAIEYKMGENNNNAVLAQCFADFDSSGFKLMYDNGTKFVWGDKTVSPFNKRSIGTSEIDHNREMIVIRHIRGENGVYVYSSNVACDEAYYVELSGEHAMKHNVSLVFGCSKFEDGAYEQYAKGTVYWSKIWYADLGNDVCSQIASWPHDNITFEACFNVNEEPIRYYLSGDSAVRSSLTFISSNVLPYKRQINDTMSNSGGWASCLLNYYLNNRFYNAFSNKWRHLMKKVRVNSLIGDNSTETNVSDCYIFVPSVNELCLAISDAYKNEGSQISHFATASSRSCRINGADYVYYWTRSPANHSLNYYYYCIGKGGFDSVIQANRQDIYVRCIISI